MTRLGLTLMIILPLVTGSLLCGQGTGKPSRAAKDRVPAWWSTSPKVKKTSFIRARAQSADKQLALDKAAASARGELAASAETRWRTLLQAIAAEDPRLPAAPSSDSTAVLRGTRIAKQATFRSKNLWTGFVLLEYPAQLVHDVLVHRLQAFPEWYAQVKDTHSVRAFEAEGM